MKNNIREDKQPRFGYIITESTFVSVSIAFKNGCIPSMFEYDFPVLHFRLSAEINKSRDSKMFVLLMCSRLPRHAAQFLKDWR